jgi:uncharacterized protein
MKKIHLVIIAVVVVGLFSLFGLSSKVCFFENCVKVKVVDSRSERAKGLMFVDNLKENEGMWFVFDEVSQHPFWMKNTLIPLDIIWIDENFIVVDIKKATPCEEEPCLIYSPEADSLYVLEVNEGWTERNGVKVGVKANFN